VVDVRDDRDVAEIGAGGLRHRTGPFGRWPGTGRTRGADAIEGARYAGGADFGALISAT
jgi:hypothetical protein